ncbi:MAG: HAD family hydrolase [Lachnospiraceae bacterium]|jgi:HAD superfamily hydrolase (TIGR01509 family)
MKIQAVLFDMDGLMVDTERQSDEGWVWACRQQGTEMPSWLMDNFKGAPRSSCIRMFDDYFKGRLDYGHTRELKNEYVAKLQSREGIPAKPGLFTLLRYLRDRQIPAIVATSTEHATAEAILRQIGAWEYLSGVVFGDQVANGKPAPDIFLLAAKKAGADPKASIVLEDSINGIRAGAAAGCAVIHVPDTIQISPEIRALTRAVVPTLAEVPGLIEEWEKGKES